MTQEPVAETPGGTDPDTPPLLDVRGLKTSFLTPDGVVEAVRGVTFGVARHEALGIVGESGSGKSVTARSILRLFGLLDRPVVEGEIWFDGRDLAKLSEREMRRVRGARISMVFQDPMTSLNPVIPVGEQIAETIRYHRHVDKEEARQRAVDLLELVGISDPAKRAKDRPYQFSGGMRQRVMVAIAVSCEPDLLIADEPTTALDVTVQAQVLRLLDELRRDLGMALIVITHDFGVVASVCDTVQVMYAGNILEQGTLEHILGQAKHPYTQGLLRLVPRFDTVRHNRLRPIPGQPPSAIDLPAGCPFAPRCEHVMDRCLAEDPPLLGLGPRHAAACWLVEDPQWVGAHAGSATGETA